MADERDLVAVLAVALAPVPVAWGWAPFESDADVPSLPLVVVQRLSYSTAGYEDMCTAAAYVGDLVVVIDAWSLGYENTRALAASIRGALFGLEPWRLQGETDLYEPTFRAWRIQGQWRAAGVAPL